MTKAYDNSLLARNISISGVNTSVSGLLSATSGNFTTSLQINSTGVSLSGHSHIIGDVTGLQTSLDSKQASGSYAASSHTHTSSQITDFNSGVSGLVSGVYAPLSGAAFTGPISATSGNFSQNLQINGTGVSLSGHTHTTSAISDSTTVGRALLTGTDATAQRTSLGLGTLATQNGTFSGTSSGTNTGDQSISISGDVTAAGSSSSLNATVTRINGIALSGLSTGLLKNTTSTGALSIAVAGTDYAVSVTAGSGIAVSSSSGAYTINAKAYSTAIGDGTATTYTITHNLSVANDSFITVRDTTTNYYVYPDIVYVGTNSIQVIFVSAPTTNQYRVTVIGV